MEYYFAPLEGITYYNFRSVHHSIFPGIDKYYTPFVVATYTHKMKSREKRDILPENNAGVPVVPQILTGDADEFVFCAKYMAEFGYSEVNLNAGCPVGTVTAKGKGAGLLRDPEKLDRLLDGIFEGLERGHVRVAAGDPMDSEGSAAKGGTPQPLSISVKTRLGWENPEEFEQILRVYLEYPISTLIVHARTRAEMYGGRPEMEAFAAAYETVMSSGKSDSDCAEESGPEPHRMRLCYNGNIRTPEDAERIKERFPKLDAVMIGRGLLENPALVTEIRRRETAEKMARQSSGGAAENRTSLSPDRTADASAGVSRDRAKLREFHDELYKRYIKQFHDERVCVDHMKEIWGYLSCSFPGSEKAVKAIRKARKYTEYEAAVRMMWNGV